MLPLLILAVIGYLCLLAICVTLLFALFVLYLIVSLLRRWRVLAFLECLRLAGPVATWRLMRYGQRRTCARLAALESEIEV